MQMFEFTLARPKNFVGTKILINPKCIVSILYVKDNVTEISFNGQSTAFSVQESYEDIKHAIAAI